MTVYKYKQSKKGEASYVGPNGEKMPQTIEVTASKLEIGSIVFLYRQGDYESATVSCIEIDPEYKWQRKVTTVTQTGKVDVTKAAASDKSFKLQCSQETAEARMERDMHIALRRKLQSLKGDVLEGSEKFQRSSLWHHRDYKPKNPKLKGYVERFAQFANEIQAMYDEIGRDMDIGQNRATGAGVTKGNT